jgi:hypothetical protein
MIRFGLIGTSDANIVVGDAPALSQLRDRQSPVDLSNHPVGELVNEVQFLIVGRVYPYIAGNLENPRIEFPPFLVGLEVSNE